GSQDWHELAFKAWAPSRTRTLAVEGNEILPVRAGSQPAVAVRHELTCARMQSLPLFRELGAHLGTVLESRQASEMYRVHLPDEGGDLVQVVDRQGCGILGPLRRYRRLDRQGVHDV